MKAILQRNNVCIEGEGEQVLLLAHGFGCDQNAWNRLKNFLNADYKLVLFDYVGAGKSDVSMYDAQRYNSLDGYATDIIEICDELALKNITFVGHSVSCMIGVLASIRRSDLFKQLIFICPSPCYISSDDYVGGFDRETIDTLLEVMEGDYLTWAKSMAVAIMHEDNGADNTKALADFFCSIDPIIAKQFAKVTFLSDNRHDLPLITVPSLTIQCADDMVAPINVGQYMHEHISNNTLQIIAAKGHCPHMSQPAMTAEAINSYLK